VRKALIQIAMIDGKSFVRREAIHALGNFAHDDTRATLRNVVRSDRSYYAIAEALKSLLKIDRDHSEEVFLNAFHWVSHHQVVEKAAGDGLVALKSTKGITRMKELLAEKQSPERRATFISILARLKPDDVEAVQQLREQLENERAHVRRAVIDAFVELGNPGAVVWLQEQRGKEETGSMLRAVDSGIEKLRNKNVDLSQLRKELDALRTQNKQLEERLKKLEAGRKQ
jgi:HEAT repeat protein